MEFLNLTEIATVSVHILCGVIALIMAPVAMVTKKGGKQHRRWGKIYFWAMFGIFVTAMGLLYFRPNIFLFIISIFSFYGALTGYRGLYRKQAGQATKLDWASSIVALLAGLSFVAWGGGTVLDLFSNGYPMAFGFLGIGFGLSLVTDAWTDLRTYRRHPADKHYWLYYHISRMSGSYVAAVTAFAVQNLSRRMPLELSWLPWVLPAVIGLPLINLVIRRYQRKLTRSKKPVSALEQYA